MTPRILFASTAAAALAACGPSQEETVTEDVATGETTEAMERERAAGEAMEPLAFAAAMAANDLYEIEAGRLAQQMGRSNSVRDFGAMMADDHTKSSSRLKQAAAQVDPPIAVNSVMEERHENDLDALRNAGQDFDSVYVRQQIAAHQQALALLRAQAADQGPLAAFAGRTAPVVEGHLERARQLP